MCQMVARTPELSPIEIARISYEYMLILIEGQDRIFINFFVLVADNSSGDIPYSQWYDWRGGEGIETE